MWTYSILPTAGTVAAGSRAGGQVSPLVPVLDAGLGSMEETEEYWHFSCYYYYIIIIIIIIIVVVIITIILFFPW